MGSSGPAGPTGPTGPVGEPGAFPTFVTISGERSAILGAVVGSQAESIANCGLNSTPLNCGWAYVGNSSDFDRTVFEVMPGFLRGEGLCTARLRRTATVGNAGGQMIATAFCTRSGTPENERGSH